jgi:hypothetical protein
LAFPSFFWYQRIGAEFIYRTNMVMHAPSHSVTFVVSIRVHPAFRVGSVHWEASLTFHKIFHSHLSGKNHGLCLRVSD